MTQVTPGVETDFPPAGRPRIVIVGGGISGLAAALRIHRTAPHVQVVVLEANARPGGKIRTEHTDGFVIEAGPDSFLRTKPWALELAREVGIDGQLVGVRQETRQTYVLNAGRLVQLPEGLSGLVPARLGPLFRSPLLSPWGKLRVALESRVPASKAGGDESLGHFMRRRMGREAYERLIEPLMSGIYGGNGDELSLEATFPRLREIELTEGSLLRGLRSAGSPAGTTAASPFVTLREGMSELVEAVLRELPPETVMTESPARTLARAGSHYIIELPSGALAADGVIIATPAGEASALLRGLVAQAADELGAIRYASSATVSLGYRLDDLPAAPEGHGYVIPRRERRLLLAVTWTSNKFPDRAPPGHLLMRGFLGRPEQCDAANADDSELVGLVRDELRATASITAEPILTRVTRWERAMPQYAVGHLDRLASIERWVSETPGLALAGALRGVGIPDCIQSGYTAAERVLTDVIATPR